MSIIIIRQEAEAARHWIESIATIDDNIFDDMCGGCAIASAYLLKRLQSRGIAARVIIGNGHCHVRVRGIIVDVTATQFQRRRILITAKRLGGPWTIRYTATSLDTYIERLRRAGWNDYKAVLHYVVSESTHPCAW
jgi:hypothetical protein